MMTHKTWLESQISESLRERRQDAPGYETDIDTARGGVKYDSDKPRVALVPPLALLDVAKVFTYGIDKYRPWNCIHGMSATRLASACMRHMLAWQAGEDDDPDSGLSHLAHAASCILMMIESIHVATAIDDRLDRDALAKAQSDRVASRGGDLRHSERDQLLAEIDRLNMLLNGKRD